MINYIPVYLKKNQSLSELIDFFFSFLFYIFILFKNILHEIYNFIILNPLKKLYFNGPYKIGFWQGLPNEDICSVITKTSSDIWRQVPDKCTQILRRNFESFHIMIVALLYSIILYRFFNYIYYKFFILPSLLKTLKKLKTPILTNYIEN